MTSDPASHRPEDIIAVHGEHPRCFLSGLWQWVDGHHILGRGYDFGERKKDEGRRAFSSILNYAPIIRDVHKFGLRDHRLMRRLLLEIAHEKVMQAVGRGRYELRPEDTRFLQIADEWLSQHPL